MKKVGVFAVFGLLVLFVSGINQTSAVEPDAVEAWGKPGAGLGVASELPASESDSAAKAAAVVVSNVHAQQYGSFVCVVYDLAVTPSGPVAVSLVASNDGGLSYNLTPSSVFGAVGSSVQPGLAKVIVWNVYADLSETQIGEAAVQIVTTPTAGGAGIPESNLFVVDTRLESLDANGDGTPDDIFDLDQDDTPDAAQDFGSNGIPDAFEDTDVNGTPDAYQDLNSNGMPDGFEDGNGDSIPDWFQDRLPLYSPSHPDSTKWYFSPEVMVDYTNYMAGTPLYGYLWVMDQNPDTIVDTGATFRGAADAKLVGAAASISGSWYFHIAAVGTNRQIVSNSQRTLLARAYIDGFVITSTSHPDPGTPSLNKTFVGTMTAYSCWDGRDWTRVPDATWSARGGFQAAVFKNRLWVMGGYAHTGGNNYYFNDVWSTLDGKTWNWEGNGGWSPRSDFQAAVFRDRLWVIGGEDINGHYGDVWSTGNGVTWTKEPNPTWSKRMDFRTAVFGQKLWLMGGWDGFWSFNDVWSTPDGRTWTQEPSAPWQKRYGFEVAVFRDRLWVMGGDDDIWSSEDGRIWRFEANWQKHTFFQAEVFNNRLWALGGQYSYDQLSNSVLSTVDGNAWEQNPNANWSARSWHQSVVFNGRLWVMGGHSGQFEHDVWASDLMILNASLAGYYYVHDTLEDTIPDTSDHFSASSTITIPGSECPPGTYWFHVSAMDAAGHLSAPAHYKFIVTDAPPVVSSSTHPDEDLPGSGVEVSFQWTSGGVPDVVKYWYAWGTNEGATPTMQTADSSITFDCVDPGVHWFVIQSEDKWGFKSPVASRKVTVGITDGPTVSSTSHPDPRTAYAARDVALTWAPETGSGDPYHYVWDRSPYSVPTAGSTSTSDAFLDQTNLSLGRYFLHLAASDDCGNLTAPSHFAVRIREARAPSVKVIPTSNKGNIGFTWTDPDSFATGAPRFHLAFDQAVSNVVTAASADSTSDYLWNEFGKPDGVYYFHIRGKDAHGNLSAQGDYTVVVGDAMVGLSAPSETVTKTGPVSYTVTYPGATAISLTNANVTLNKTGTANGSVSVGASSDPLSREITISGITGDGTLGITISAGTATYSGSKTAPLVGPSGTFVVDNTPPQLTISNPEPPATSLGPVQYTLTYQGATDILLAPADVTLVAEPAGAVGATVELSGDGNTSRTVSLTNCWGNGKLSIQVVAGTATDAAGGMANGANSTKVSIDTIPPTGTVVINGGAAWTKTAGVSLALTYSDGANGSGVSQMRFSNDGTNWTLWEAVATSKSWTLTTGDGVKTAYAQFRDAAGNVSTSATDTIALDATAPTGAVVINGGAAYARSGAVSLTLTYADGTGSGVSQMRFSNDGTNWTAWETAAATKGWTLSTGDGPKTVYVQFNDVAGNVSGNLSDGIFLDTVVPTGTVAINGGATLTNSLDVILTLAASDPNPASGVDVMRFSNDGTNWSNWEVFATSKAWSLPEGDGYKAVRAQFRDKAGNESLTSSSAIQLDMTAPTGTVIINGGAAYTNNKDVALVLTASDGTGSGVTDMRFSNDGTNWLNWEAFAASKAWSLTTGDGSKTVYAQFRDTAGNVSATASDTIVFDITPPTGTVTVNSGAAWTKTKDVTLTFTTDDGAGSGVSEMRLSNDGTNWNAWEAFAASKAWSLATGDGQKTVYAQFRDRATNISNNVHDDIGLDTVSPSGSIVINGGAPFTKSRDVTLSLTANDPNPGSGLSQMRFSNDGTNWSDWENYGQAKAWNLTAGDGTKTVSIEFKDLAGNTSTKLSASIKLDMTGPTGGIVVNDGAAFTNNRNVTLTLSAEDGSGSGIADMQFSDDGNAWSAWEAFGSSKTHVLFSGDGPKTVYARFRDKLGNVSGVVSDAITLDTVVPTGTISINQNSEWTTAIQVTLAFTADDGNGSGAGWIRLSNDNTEWTEWAVIPVTRVWPLPSGDGLKTVYAQIRDRAGNVSEPISDSVKLDSTAPTGTAVINNGAAYTDAQEVMLSLTSDDGDGSGSDSMRISNDGTNWSPWEAFADSKAWSVTAGDGLKTVHVEFRDKLGNFSVPLIATIMFDTTPPDVVLATPSLRVAGPFVVTATFSDPVAGFGFEDVLVTNATVGGFSGSGNTYQWTTIPAGDEPVSVLVGEGVCVNPVNLPNTESNVLVVAIDHPPTAEPQEISLTANEGGTITLGGSDLDSDPLTYRIVVPPAHGTLEGEGPDFVYTPDDGYVGQDTFTFVTNDGVADSEPVTVTITVTPPPVGSLTVTLDPEYARSANAQWRVDGGDWHASGETVDNLKPGEHVIAFLDIPDEDTGGCSGTTRHYVTPLEQNVTVTANMNTTVTVTYETTSKNLAAQFPAGGRQGDLLTLGFVAFLLTRFEIKRRDNRSRPL